MVTSSDAHAAPRLQEAKERCGSQLWLAHTRTQPVLTDTNTSTIKTIHCNPKSLRQTDRERERGVSLPGYCTLLPQHSHHPPCRACWWLEHACSQKSPFVLVVSSIPPAQNYTCACQKPTFNMHTFFSFPPNEMPLLSASTRKHEMPWGPVQTCT